MKNGKKTLRLLNLVQLVFFIGFLNPLISLAIKIAAHDYGWLRQLRYNVPSLDKFFKQNPHLDLSLLFPNLGKLSWHPFNPELGAADDYAYMGVMLRMSFFCLLMLLSTLFLRRRVVRWLEPISAWLEQTSYRKERRLVFLFCFILIIAYPLKWHMGFWYPGIGGWSYKANVTHVVNTPPMVPEGRRLTGEAIPSFLYKALLVENRKYIRGTGFLTKDVMFLHFEDGQALPASNDLLNIVFPRYIFGKDYQRLQNTDAYTQIITYSLSRRQKNRRSVLPLSLSYPNHTVYLPIDYRSYPDASTLQKISLWQVTVRLEDGVDQPQIAQAANWMEIHVR